VEGGVEGGYTGPCSWVFGEECGVIQTWQKAAAGCLEGWEGTEGAGAAYCSAGLAGET
jgi:hypothetical protein